MIFRLNKPCNLLETFVLCDWNLKFEIEKSKIKNVSN